MTDAATPAQVDDLSMTQDAQTPREKKQSSGEMLGRSAEPQAYAELREADRPSLAEKELGPHAIPLVSSTPVEPGETRLADAATWDEWLSASVGRGLDRLGPVAGRRLLLVGARTVALDCAATRVETDGVTWRVRLVAGTVDRIGCAIALIDDDRIVIVVEPDGRETRP